MYNYRKNGYDYKQNVCHRHERGNTANDFRLNAGIIFFKMKHFF